MLWLFRYSPCLSVTSLPMWTRKLLNRSVRLVLAGVNEGSYLCKLCRFKITPEGYPLQAIITLILATDMARHGEILDSFKHKVDNFDFTNEEHVTCVCTQFHSENSVHKQRATFRAN